MTSAQTAPSGSVQSTASSTESGTARGIGAGTTAVSQPAARSKAPTPTEVVLPNGLKVILLEDHSYPVVSCLAWYGVGARNERVGNTGITHLLEHMLFGNVGTFRKGEIGASIARVGGQFNGYTSDDFTTFFETLPANKLELALRIESERMRSAKFSDADLQEEISNVQREFENEAKDPIALLSQEVRAMLYVHHPYHNPTMGWRTDVEAVTAAQVKAYYDNYFWPNNCTLVLSGDFDSKNVNQLVERYFGGLPRAPNPVPAIKIAQEPQRSERRSTIKYAGKQEILEMAFHAPALEDPDAPALVVLEKLLNASSAGRLKSKLIESKICSTAICAFEAKKDPGFIALTCTAIPGTGNAQQKIIDSIDNVITQLRSTPVSDAELRRARNQAEFAFLSEREGPYRAGFHLGYFDNLSSWKCLDAWAEKLRAVSAADIQRVSKRYLNPESRVIAWLQGAGAQKSPAQKTEPSTPTPRPNLTKPDTRLTGYKQDDNAVSPSPSQNAIQKLPAAAASAIRELPAALGAIPAAVGRQLMGAQENRVSTGRTNRRVLKNGITLVVHESHLSPIIQVAGSIRAGSAYESAGKRGLAAVTATMFNNGTARRGRTQIVTQQEDLGIQPSHMLRFDDATEAIQFSTRCLSRDVTNQLDLIAETVTAPALQEADVEKAKQDAIAEIQKVGDTNPRKAERALYRSLLAQGSPLTPEDPSEAVKSATAITATDLRKFLNNFVVPPATTIVLVGDIDIDAAEKLVERSFGTWNAKGVHQRVAAHHNSRHVMRTAVPTKDKTKTTLGFGKLVPLSTTSSDYGNLLIADTIFSKHPLFSRLGQKLTQDDSLARAIGADSIDTDLKPVADSVAWSFAIDVEPNAVPLTVAGLQKELKQFGKQGVTQEEFVEARRYLLGALPVRSMSTVGSAARSLLNSSIRSEEADSQSALLANLRSTNIDAVNRLIRHTLKPESATMVVVGNSQSIRSTRNQVASQASKEIEQDAPAEEAPSAPIQEAPTPATTADPAPSADAATKPVLDSTH